MDQQLTTFTPAAAATVVNSNKPQHKSRQHQQCTVLLRLLLRKTGVLCLLLLLLAKLVANEPLFVYVMQYYSHSGNPLTLRIWRKLGADLL